MPAIFLLILGIGNLSVGLYKASQYKNLLLELSNEKPKTKLLANASPLTRIEYEKTSSNRLYKRQAHAKQKLNFYRLVSFGGRLFIALGFILFSLGLILIQTNKRNARQLQRNS